MLEKLGLKDLELVKILCDHGSITAASHRRHVSQPAISQRLSALQHRLGVSLFVRIEGVMKPTEIGLRLREAAINVTTEIESAEHDIQQIISSATTRLRITTECYTCYRWLPFVIRDLHKTYPDLNVDVVPDATADPFGALENNIIDLALVSSAPGKATRNSQHLFGDELLAVMSEDHPLASRSYLNPKDFRDQSLVLYSGTNHPILEHVLDPAGITPGKVIQIQITEAIIELARAGMGIAILAEWAFDDIQTTSGLIGVRIGRAGFKREWSVAFNPACQEDYIFAFTRSARHMGKTISKRNWREKLEGLA